MVLELDGKFARSWREIIKYGGAISSNWLGDLEKQGHTFFWID